MAFQVRLVRVSLTPGTQRAQQDPCRRAAADTLRADDSRTDKPAQQLGFRSEAPSRQEHVLPG